MVYVVTIVKVSPSKMCGMRDTWEIAGIDTFLYLWLPVEQVYGGGLLFNRGSERKQ